MSVGERIDQGDIIGYIDNDGHPFDPLNGYILDVGFFVAKPDLFDNDAGNSANIEKYIDPGPLLIDGLKKDYMIFRMPGCKEDPVTSL
jgi:murein DD-endopeptidase MepM/ murein hydrolase activator NlpD